MSEKLYLLTEAELRGMLIKARDIEDVEDIFVPANVYADDVICELAPLSPNWEDAPVGAKYGRAIVRTEFAAGIGDGYDLWYERVGMDDGPWIPRPAKGDGDGA